MASISLDALEAQLSSVVQRVEDGETIVVMRDGEPVLDIAPHQNGKRKDGLDFEAGEAFLRAKGIERRAGFISPDFDDPLPEDFLIRPFPDRA